MRKRLHGAVPITSYVESSYHEFQEGFQRIFPSPKAEPVKEAEPAKEGEGYNAVLLRHTGEAEGIWVNFETVEGLSAPLEARGVSAISTVKLQQLGHTLGFPLVGYCDRHCGEKNLPENERAEDLAGYDGLFGDVVLCTWSQSDYAPLTPEDAQALLTHLA